MEEMTTIFGMEAEHGIAIGDLRSLIIIERLQFEDEGARMGEQSYIKWSFGCIVVMILGKWYPVWGVLQVLWKCELEFKVEFWLELWEEMRSLTLRMECYGLLCFGEGWERKILKRSNQRAGKYTKKSYRREWRKTFQKEEMLYDITCHRKFK